MQSTLAHPQQVPPLTERATPGEVQPTPPLNGPTNILLVDDEPRNLDVLESLLAAPDYRLVRAQTPDEALMALVRDDFVCIVLDIQMPQMNGIELVRLIKTRKRCQHVPVIFLTAYFQEEKDMLQGYGAGAVDYLTKPINPQILKSKVTVFVELFRTTRALAAANVALEQEIAQRQAAEAALRQANETLLSRIHERQQLERLVLTISEREQQRIGQDLHDGLCQQLTGIKFRNRLLEEKLTKLAVPESQDARAIEGLLNQAIEQARNQARGLNPVRLEADGLTAALQDLASNVTSVFNVQCVFDSAEPVSVDDHGVAVHLYRITQEAITNAIKHGNAGTIRLEFIQTDEGLRFTIEDDGVGFVPVPGKESGMGLHIMNYRARAIGATLEVRKGQRGGTLVTCSLPSRKA